MHEVYGIDLDSGDYRGRSWRWLSSRIRGLFRRPPIYVDGTPIPSTRIGLQLEPPPEPKSK